ncbi:MAG: serine/threonine protein kinase [Anaerolineae bacterium]|nr:serine/threonine protein kinase [Anaerolineae bacterium]
MSEGLDRIKPGDRVGPYRIVRQFKGRGGMARIFEVEVREKYRRSDLPRRLALKVAKPEHQAALTAEADFLRSFDHPNVVRIFPLPGYHRPVYSAREEFSFGWGWYYAMELVDGGSLEKRLTRPTTITDVLRPPQEGGRCLSLLEALGVARQLAVALEHIHLRCVVNLDVKPGNVLFRRRRFRWLRSSVPQAVLCDFGISRDLRFAHRADFLGMVTPGYMSPEQALEKSRHSVTVDTRSDIFSLGIVLYEMLTGSLPFEDMGQLIDPTYVPPSPRQLRPSVPPRLNEIVMQALAKEPSHRPRSATEIRGALERAATPFDWGAAARRAFAVAAVGFTLTTCLAVGGYGAMCVASLLQSTPCPTSSPTAVVTPVEVVETPGPAEPTFTVSPTSGSHLLTSTPASTLTPIPPTPTTELTFTAGPTREDG